MGDRANIAIVQHPPRHHLAGQAIYLYTHFQGYGLPAVLQKALASKAGQRRLDDEAYLARIILDAMMLPDDHGHETGYGITSYLTDWNHPTLVVDTERKTVGIASAEECPTTQHEWTIQEYLDLDFGATNPWDVLARAIDQATGNQP